MCGIIASIATEDCAAEMLATISHRGPDGHGGKSIGLVTLHANRLAIIDPKAEDTVPFSFGGFLLAYNGEIYNHREVRGELKKKRHTFRTNTDTETLIHAWAEWGEECLKRLNGMFAFAMSDGNTLWLVRDRAGEKPLYFHASRDRFLAASEAKALMAVVHPKERRDVFFDTFEYCRGKTLLAGIEEVLPAEIVKVDVKTRKVTRRIWWTPETVRIDERTADEALEALLEDAVQLRMLSDVPVALYVSGGIDSEIIRSFLPEVTTLTFDENAGHEEQFLATLHEIVRSLDFPVGSFSPFGLWWLAKQARERGCKVVLSGEGADELFGGYERMVMYQQVLLTRVGTYTPLWDRVFGTPEALYARFTARHGKDASIASLIATEGQKTPLLNACKFEFDYLLPMLLQMGDRMAMAHGVENRCPFLDHRIINFAFSLGWDEWRVYEGKGKVILRKILARRSPGNPALTMPKKGLFLPINRWLGGGDSFDRTLWRNKQIEIWRSQR